jgi:hypothetical protein
LVCELAAEFFPCVLEVLLRPEEPLADLPDVFAALPLEPLFELLFELDVPEDEEPVERLPVLDELDEGAAGGVAAFGGCGGVTGPDRMESSATRSHSLRPDAL